MNLDPDPSSGSTTTSTRPRTGTRTGLRARAIRLLRRNYRLARLHEAWRLDRKHGHRGRPLVVYQMGKVGSTSVHQALGSLEPGFTLYHVHTLDPTVIASAERAYARAYKVRGVVPDHLIEARRLLEDLQKGQPRGRWKVVTLVRDPIARNVSAFFQDLEMRHPDFQYARKAALLSRQTLADELAELFLNRHDHDEPLRWFGRELSGKLGIDVFAKPFPHDRGWDVYSGPLADVLLLRLENLAATMRTAMASFIEGCEPSPAVANAASSKRYAEVYQAFEQSLHLPEAYLKRMYDSALARHFYTDAERDTFARRWSRVTRPESVNL